MTPGARIAAMECAIAAVLAGGSSTRFGSPKAELEIDGRTFLEHIVEMLLREVNTVYVCGGDRALPGSILIHDPLPNFGPLGGLVSALHRAGEGPVFVTAVDMPLLSVDTVERLMSPRPLRGQARIARVDDRPQPLCGAFSGDLAQTAEQQLRVGNRSMMSFLGAIPHLELVDITDGSLFNVNTPEDYQQLLNDLS
jgi:molybdenum cofactor guanylyltransferase